MVDAIEVKTPHRWTISYGYDPATYCECCHANSYESYGTEFCEDYRAEKQKRLEQKERRHAPTEAAWARARSLLTREEWELMELDRYPLSRPHRVVDRIEIK